VRRRRGDGVRGGGLGRSRQAERERQQPRRTCCSVRQTRWRWRVLASKWTRVGVEVGIFVTLGAGCGGWRLCGFAWWAESNRPQQWRVRAEGDPGAGGRNEIGWKGLRWAANLRKAALWLAVGRFLATVRGLGTKADDDFQS